MQSLLYLKKSTKDNKSLVDFNDWQPFKFYDHFFILDCFKNLSKVKLHKCYFLLIDLTLSLQFSNQTKLTFEKKNFFVCKQTDLQPNFLDISWHAPKARILYYFYPISSFHAVVTSCKIEKIQCIELSLNFEKIRKIFK